MTDDIRGFYDELADDYHLIYADWTASVRRQAAALDRVIRDVLGDGVKRILDCTCGIGTQALGLALLRHQVVGTDVSPGAIERARAEAGALGLDVRFEVADLRDLEHAVAGEFDVVLSCDNSLPHLLSDVDLRLGIRAMLTKVRPVGLFLASTRDYDQLLQTKPTSTQPMFTGSEGQRRLVFQLWDWGDDRSYNLELFLMREREDGWAVHTRRSTYRAIRRAELSRLVREAGCAAPRWLLPAESGFFQPLLLAVKSSETNQNDTRHFLPGSGASASSSRGAEEVLTSVVAWVKSQASIRGAVLIGSRATLSAPVDALSDYDIVLFVRDRSLYEYEATDAWLGAFGEILVLLHEQYDLLGATVPARLVQYEDGVRIDFSICRLELLERVLQRGTLPEMLDAGYRVLVDKDGRLSELPSPTHRAFVPRRPLETEYRRVVNEFWWETIYVAKNLARQELLPARYSSECVLRFGCLLRMLEWYVQTTEYWNEPLGPYGRGLFRRLGEKDQRLLTQTYAAGEPAANWNALFAMTELFAHASSKVREDLGFADAGALRDRVERFLRQIQARAEEERAEPETD